MKSTKNAYLKYSFMEIVMITLISVSTYFYFRNWYLDKKIKNLIRQTN